MLVSELGEVSTKGPERGIEVDEEKVKATPEKEGVI